MGSAGRVAKFYLVFLAVFAVCVSSLSGSAGGEDAKVADPGVYRGIDNLLATKPRVMWIAAHPDDESMMGTVLARASLFHGCPMYFLILTHGDGGECCIKGGCHPDLKTVREGEIKKAAAMYHATLQLESYYNAPLPVESFPLRHEIAKKWKEQGDPVPLIAKAIREFKPDIIFTFEPTRGFTGHPEHQLASRFAIAGIKMAADPETKIGELKPFRVGFTYFGLNRLFPYKIAGKADPGPVTEKFDATLSCIGDKNCRDMMAEFTKAHQSQNNDMKTVRWIKGWIYDIPLRKVDPFTEIYDPYEPVKSNNM